MTRERIEGMREVVLPFVKKKLLETNYENLGESDAEEFAREFNEILDLAIKALEQEPRWIPVSEKLPKEDGRYLVTVRNLTGDGYLDNNVFECEFFYINWIFKGWQDNKVIAWMPLPETLWNEAHKFVQKK